MQKKRFLVCVVKIILKAVVLNRGMILPPRDIWQRLETFLIVMRWSITTGTQQVEAGEAAIHPTMRQRIVQSKMSVLLRLRNPALYYSKLLNLEGIYLLTRCSKHFF